MNTVLSSDGKIPEYGGYASVAGECSVNEDNIDAIIA